MLYDRLSSKLLCHHSLKFFFFFLVVLSTIKYSSLNVPHTMKNSFLNFNRDLLRNYGEHINKGIWCLQN